MNFYSNLNDGEVQKRIGSLGKENLSNNIGSTSCKFIQRVFGFGNRRPNQQSNYPG